MTTIVSVAPAIRPEPPPYAVETLDHRRLTERLNAAAVDTPLLVPPDVREGPRAWHRASGLAGCLRRAGYRTLELATTDPAPVNAANQMAATMGTALHIRIQEQLLGAGLVLRHPGFAHPVWGDAAVELALRDHSAGDAAAALAAWRFNGHLDAVLAAPDGALAVFDLKTIAPDKLANPSKLAEKIAAWAVQVSAYMAFFVAPDGRTARTAYVYVVSRGDTRDRRLLRVRLQPARWQHDVQRLARATQALEAGLLPEAEPERDACPWCPWFSRCCGRGKDGD